MDEPDNLVLRLLRELRADMDQRFEANDLRIRAVENRIESIRQATIGESVLGRYTVAEVEEQLMTIRTRLDLLEAQG